MALRLDKEKAKRNAQVILDKMRKDTDLFQLKEYYRIYKKEISLFNRSHAAAWLFMYYDERENPPVSKITNQLKSDRQEKAQTSAEIINIPEEESKRLFISIGKNRRLFPREVITLIMSKTSSAREDIGSIRILDNYSFVQVRDKKADEIIEALNGIKFRGRTLAVNYAKPKSETDI